MYHEIDGDSHGVTSTIALIEWIERTSGCPDVDVVKSGSSDHAVLNEEGTLDMQ